MLRPSSFRRDDLWFRQVIYGLPIFKRRYMAEQLQSFPH
jgi:hypothetical protein